MAWGPSSERASSGNGVRNVEWCKKCRLRAWPRPTESESAIRVCILTMSSGDMCIQWNLRSSVHKFRPAVTSPISESHLPLLPFVPFAHSSVASWGSWRHSTCQPCSRPRLFAFPHTLSFPSGTCSTVTSLERLP